MKECMPVHITGLLDSVTAMKSFMIGFLCVQ